jgi:hypothetical protein
VCKMLAGKAEHSQLPVNIEREREVSERELVTKNEIPVLMAYTIKTSLEAHIGRQQAHNALHSVGHSESERPGHAQEQTGEEHEHTVRATENTETIREVCEREQCDSWKSDAWAPAARSTGRLPENVELAKAEANGHGIS